MLITTPEKAMQLKDKVGNVYIYSIDQKPAKELEKAGIQDLSTILPKADLINDVSKGNVGRKKAIKKHVKRVMKMKAGDDCVLTMNTLARITKMSKSKKTPLIILVSTEEGKIGKFIQQAVSAAFNAAYGFKFTSYKQLKKAKIFKGKKKKRKAKLSEIAIKLTRMSDKGKKFYKAASRFYFPEYLYSELFGNALVPEKIIKRMKKMKLNKKNKKGKKDDSLVILFDLIKNDKKIAKEYKSFRKQKNLLNALGIKLKLGKKGKDLTKNKVSHIMLFLCHLVAVRRGFTAQDEKEYRQFFQEFLTSFDKVENTSHWNDFKKELTEANKVA